jgi:hypothetical protein
MSLQSLSTFNPFYKFSLEDEDVQNNSNIISQGKPVILGENKDDLPLVYPSGVAKNKDNLSGHVLGSIDFRDNLLIADEDILRKLNSIRVKITRLTEFASKCENLAMRIFTVLDYAKMNQDNEMSLADSYLPEKYHEGIHDGLKSAERAVLWINSVVFIIFNCIKANRLNRYKDQLKECEEKFSSVYFYTCANYIDKIENDKDLKIRILSIQRIFFDVHRLLDNEREKISTSLTSKSLKIFFDFTAYAFEQICFFSAASKVSKCLGYAISNIRSLYNVSMISSLQDRWIFSLHTKESEDQCTPRNRYNRFKLDLMTKNLEDLKKLFFEYGINVHFPLTIEVWRMRVCDDEFVRQLYIAYDSYEKYERIVCTPELEKYYEEQLKIKKNKAIEQFKQIEDRICVSSGNLGVGENSSPLERLVSENIGTIRHADEGQRDIVRDALVVKWIKHQQELEKNLMSSLGRALLDKNQIEKRSLNFYKIEKMVGLASSLVHFCLFFPITTGKALLKMCVTDLAKIAIGKVYVFPLFFFPFNPEMNFKIDSVIMQIIKKFYMAQKKPNEYSVQGYLISFEVTILEFRLYIQQSSCILSHLAYRSYVVVVKNGILRRNIVLKDEQPRKFAVEERIKELDGNLQKLRLEDVKTLVSPLVSLLNEADFTYFSPRACRFFQENTGISLMSRTPQFDSEKQKSLEKFFCLSGAAFVKSYEINRFSMV